VLKNIKFSSQDVRSNDTGLADGMKALIGFLSVIAVELLQLTYLHRTQPSASALEILILLNSGF